MACCFSICRAQTLKIPAVDNTTYEGKVMFGYQGWYGHPDDESAYPDYWHWGDISVISTDYRDVEMYPDLREYCSDEKYPTAYTFADNSISPVFSSGNRHSIMRHIKWVRDYNVDGVFVQRFISEVSSEEGFKQFRDDVTTSVMEASQLYGRIFAIMYDGVSDAVEDIKEDWMHLVDDLGICDSPSYLHHDGRPLVALWGFTFDESATVDQLVELIDWFHNTADVKYRASVKLGLNDNWFNLSQDWLDAFANVEVISPWSVGRYSNQQSYNNYLSNQLFPGKSWCESRGILYVPVIWPGFSWYNLYDATTPKNQIPRDGGNFYWMQSYGAVNADAQTIYIAMLDEMDEATVMFKTAEDADQSPAQGYWLDLDDDGYILPSDWYLRCAGKTAETLRGNITNSSSLGTPNEGIMAIRPDDDLCQMTFIFPDFANETMLEISLDSGITYPYNTADNAGSYVIGDREADTFQVFARHPGSDPAPMGEVRIFGDCANPSSSLSKANNHGDIVIFPNPSKNIFFLKSKDILNIQVYNSNGNIVLSQYGKNEVDLSIQPDGIYMFKIVTKDHIVTKKVIKK
jgi:hypothetical protein